MARLDLIQFRRGTAAAWTSANPVLAAGEPGFEADTGKWKVGDGTTAWTSLAYAPANGLTTNTAQTVSAVKTFTADPVFNANAIPESAVNGLTADLAAKATDSAVVHNLLWDAHSIVKADADNTPIVLVMPLDTGLFRLTGVNGGEIGPASAAQIKTFLAISTSDVAGLTAYIDAEILAQTLTPPIGVSDGGTGSTTAAAARTALGLAIGTNVQAWDADLDTIAAISGSRGDILFYGASGWARLAAGTAGQVLQTAGSGADPLWVPSSGRWPSGSYLQVEGPTGTTLATAAQCRYMPLWVPEAQTISEIDIETTVAGSTGSVIRVGIFSLDANGRPGNLLNDFGTIDGTQTAGVLPKTGLSQAVTRGLYWIGVSTQGAPTTEPTLRTVVGTSRFINPTSLAAGGNRAAFTQASVSGAFANANPLLTGSNASGFWAAVKAA